MAVTTKGRDYYINKGVCPNCSSRPLIKGKKICKECSIRQSLWAKAKLKADKASSFCPSCGSKKEIGKAKCLECTLKLKPAQQASRIKYQAKQKALGLNRNAYARKYRAKNKERLSKYKKQHYIKNRDRYQKVRADYLKKKREEVFTHYGNRCAWCGETNPVFLSIDHVHDDGHLRRKVEGNGKNFYRYITTHGFSDNYQLLCFNCNSAKAFRGLTKRDVIEYKWMESIDFST